ncbi:MAG: hypothetical protein PSV40_15800 [Polaromonas sp.]|uniref:hypothetical protein n=1 Tax=Polaromonas sp. TaxID=1869339 RepID=UPI002488E7F6|nr:hypothetical protein [Polaromonas sp.]MDI1270552.1 hypothetical protein [Polaromonas sp.]
MDEPYVVALQGIDEMPSGERFAAEVRFVKELEKSLGGPNAVVAVYSAWLEASTCDAVELTTETSSLAVKWPKAFGVAQRAGLKAVGEGDGHFELRLQRQHAVQ